MADEQYIPCLSLCEIAPTWKSAQEASERIEKLTELDSFADAEPERVYIGSSFCPQLFELFNESRTAMLAEWCAGNDVNITLVTPIATERSIESCESNIERLVETCGGVIDEVTANDFGMLDFLAELADRVAPETPLRINVGRLMSKDTRDPRDTAYDKTPHVPRLLERDWRGWRNLDRLAQTWPISGIELDPTHAQLDLSSLPDDMTVALYGPLCYMSTGQICEFASIGKETDRKFRPNDSCQLQCQRTALRYRGASGTMFHKIGRSVFFERPDCKVAGASNYRFVFAPLKEVLG